MNDRQLATKNASLTPAHNGDVNLADFAGTVAAATHKAIVAQLDHPRTLIKGGQRASSGVTFARVGQTVIKVSSETLTRDLIYNVARHTLTYSPDQVTVSIAPASEVDLLDAQRSLTKGSDQIAIREFLATVRGEAPQPLRIEVVNANELAPRAKVASVKRDDSGKLTGMVVESVPDP